MRLQLSITGLLVFAAGCGGTNIVEVSGRVKMGDKPIANATVIFQPLSDEPNAGPGSQGRTDKNGQYSLQLMTGAKSGALVGRHRVTITAYEGEEETPSSGSDMKFRKRIVPDAYNVNSKLTFDVPPGGTTEANFELQAAPPR
jgi:hypothetical protein